MSKKVVNLGKVKGRTLDLKVDNKVLKKKYDDEAEWQELGKVGGIDTVDTVNDLPADAEKDDIAFVKEAAFVETVEYQEENPIIIQDGEQTFNFELKQNPMYLAEVNLIDKHPELVHEGASITVVYYFDTPYSANGEIMVQCSHFSSLLMSSGFGINNNLDLYLFDTYNSDETMTTWFKLRGLSIKDYFTIVVGLEISDEQYQVLLGEHYADNSIDNPSYEWIKLNATTEPINENSVNIDEMYYTVEFNAVAELKSEGIFDSIEIDIMDENTDSILSFMVECQYPEEYTPEKYSAALGYANTFVNLLFSGSTKTTSYDVYSKKGFHKFDEEWKSLEEDMNIPKVVERHSDLPKSFIKNGIMVVANDEEILAESTSKLEVGVPVLVRVNPIPSVQGEIEKLKQYFIQNGASSNIDWDNCNVYLGGEFYDENDDSIGRFFIDKATENSAYTILLDLKKNTDDTLYYISYYYFDEAGAEIYVPPVDSSSDNTIYTTDEGGCWYCMEYYPGDKENILKSQPQKVKFEDWFNLSDVNVYCDYIWCGYEDDNDNYDELELISYEFANMLKICDNNKKIVYPKGFYMYAKNRWWHQPEIAGNSFDNVDVLQMITAEDVGSFHGHDNKNVLDKIDDYFLNRTYTSNSQTHYHDNKNYLDQITSNKHVHTHNNKDVLDTIEKRIEDTYINGNRIIYDYLIFSDDWENKIVVPGVMGKQVVETVYELQSIEILPYCFFEIYPNSNCIRLSISSGISEYSPMIDAVQEYMFSINTSRLQNDIEFHVFAEKWLSERLIVLSPNKYYEFSIVDNKIIHICTEVGDI